MVAILGSQTGGLGQPLMDFIGFEDLSIVFRPVDLQISSLPTCFWFHPHGISSDRNTLIEQSPFLIEQSPML